MLVIGRDDARDQVATADPTNVVALDDVKLYTGATSVTVVVATDIADPEQLRRAWAMLEQDAEMSNVSDDADAMPPTSTTSRAPPIRRPTVRLAASIVDRRRARPRERHPRRAADRRSADPVPHRRPAARHHEGAAQLRPPRSSAA